MSTVSVAWDVSQASSILNIPALADTEECVVLLLKYLPVAQDFHLYQSDISRWPNDIHALAKVTIPDANNPFIWGARSDSSSMDPVMVTDNDKSSLPMTVTNLQNLMHRIETVVEEFRKAMSYRFSQGYYIYRELRVNEKKSHEEIMNLGVRFKQARLSGHFLSALPVLEGADSTSLQNMHSKSGRGMRFKQSQMDTDADVLPVISQCVFSAQTLPSSSSSSNLSILSVPSPPPFKPMEDLTAKSGLRDVKNAELTWEQFEQHRRHFAEEWAPLAKVITRHMSKKKLDSRKCAYDNYMATVAPQRRRITDVKKKRSTRLSMASVPSTLSDESDDDIADEALSALANKRRKIVISDEDTQITEPLFPTAEEPTSVVEETETKNVGLSASSSSSTSSNPSAPATSTKKFDFAKLLSTECLIIDDETENPTVVAEKSPVSVVEESKEEPTVAVEKTEEKPTAAIEEVKEKPVVAVEGKKENPKSTAAPRVEYRQFPIHKNGITVLVTVALKFPSEVMEPDFSLTINRSDFSLRLN